MKTFTIKIEIFDARVIVQAGGSIQQAETTYQKKIAPAEFKTSYPNMLACCLNSELCKSSVIWFKDNKPGGGIVAHEALHAAFHCLNLSAVHPTAEEHETLAYLQEFIIRQIGLRVW